MRDEASSISPCLCAIVVTYQPDEVVFLELLESIRPQVDFMVVVDNGSGKDFCNKLKSLSEVGLRSLFFGENKGIASAQNAGIDFARSCGATHVVLFDHDSKPQSEMVKRLLVAFRLLQEDGRSVASVGPCYQDVRQRGLPPFVQTKGLSLVRRTAPDVRDCASVDYLNASGCLIPMSVIDAVGLMDEDLFIDYVDIEWGQRARNKGYENFGCFSALMEHSLGDEPISFMGTSYPARSPLRHYYMFRNAVLLYRMKHVPADWKWADGFRLILKFGFYTLFANPRFQHFRMMSKGLWHGLQGRTGRYDHACAARGK